MSKVPGFLRRLVLPLLLVGLVACGSDDTGVDPVEITVRFEPDPGDLTVVAWVRVQFRAFDEKNDSVTAQFYVDGELVRVDELFEWRGEELGNNVIVAEVEHSGKTFRAEWRVEVTDQGAQDPPPVSLLQAGEGEMPGTIHSSWNRPSDSQHPTPIKEYVVAYSTTPLTDSTFDMAPQSVVPHNLNSITQRHDIEGLVERQQYHIRIRTRDVLDRESGLSLEVSSEATGHYDVTGRVYEVDRNPIPPRPLNRVLVDMEGIKAFTNASGTFELLNIPDLAPRGLIAVEDQGVVYYTVSTGALPPVSRDFEFVLFPRDFVLLDQGERIITLLEYLRTMTENRVGSDRTLFFRWAEYPVDVLAHDYQVVGASGETVDYRLAMIEAADRWNQQAGLELIRIVDTLPDVGAYYTTDLVVGGNFHGIVVLERPSGQIYEVVPELVRVRLRGDFATQDTAVSVMTHELGHVLYLSHSSSADHIMNVGLSPSTGGMPHRDEAYVAWLLSNLPIGMDAGWYAEPE